MPRISIGPSLKRSRLSLTGKAEVATYNTRLFAAGARCNPACLWKTIACIDILAAPVQPVGASPGPDARPGSTEPRRGRYPAVAEEPRTAGGTPRGGSSRGLDAHRWRAPQPESQRRHRLR